jgi:hypothetical protein
MLKSVRNKWKLKVTPNLGFPILPPVLANLNGGVLHILGQHKTDVSDTFDMFVGHLIGKDTSQHVGGAIDEHDHVGFIFLADGKITGTQYVFQGQHKDDGTIGGSIILPAGDDNADTDLGSWSGTGGGSDGDGDCDED